MQHRSGLVVAAAAACVTGLLASGPAVAAPAPSTHRPQPPSENARLSAGMAEALRTAGFDELVDYNDRVDGLAQQVSVLPNVDLAVIELDRRGQVAAAANVLYDRDSPDGFQVRVDPRTLEATGVQFARWDADRFADPVAWDAGPAAGDVLEQPRRVEKQYMVTYPASVLKVMVGYEILRLVDRRKLALDTPVVYQERDGQTCAYGPSNPDGLDPAPVADGATDTVAGWFDQMITVSDNFATCVLLQEIYDQGALVSANAHFRSLGLDTLVMEPRYPAVGSGWSSGHFSMGSLDTARLLLLVAGARGPLWTTPQRRVVTAAAGLSPRSRQYFERVLLEQSFNEVLNPVNLCDSTETAQGIPSTVSDRWIDPDTGNVVTYDGDLVIDFGYDVRPCIERAEVSFAHKTGLVSFAGSDAGIVRALPGQDGRTYVVAIQSSIGYRYGDPDWAASDPNACEDSPYVCYPRGFGRIGQAVDTLVKARPAAPWWP